jgi:hypothetical protein
MFALKFRIKVLYLLYVKHLLAFDLKLNMARL